MFPYDRQARCRPARTAPMAVLLTFILCVGGCGPSNTSTDHEDHLEHHVPEHKPADFEAAIKQLQVRFERLRTDQADHGGEQSPMERQELRDVVDWLPELAGDSDMKKPEWDTVRKSSLALAALLQQLEEETADAPQSRHDTISAAWRRELETLRHLIPQPPKGAEIHSSQK